MIGITPHYNLLHSSPGLHTESCVSISTTNMGIEAALKNNTEIKLS